MGRDFRELAGEYAGRVFTYAFYSLRQREEAEDVTQEVLVRLWKHQATIEPAHTGAWVMRVARNLVIDVSRRQRARAVVIADGPAAEESAATVTTGETPEAAMRRTELREVIQRALAGLNEPYRSIVVMREIQGLTYEEIAAGMDMPLGTIKVYLHRARRVLRETVRREMGNNV